MPGLHPRTTAAWRVVNPSQATKRRTSRSFSDNAANASIATKRSRAVSKSVPLPLPGERCRTASLSTRRAIRACWRPWVRHSSASTFLATPSNQGSGSDGTSSRRRHATSRTLARASPAGLGIGSRQEVGRYSAKMLVDQQLQLHLVDPCRLLGSSQLSSGRHVAEYYVASTLRSVVPQVRRDRGLLVRDHWRPSRTAELARQGLAERRQPMSDLSAGTGMGSHRPRRALPHRFKKLLACLPRNQWTPPSVKSDSARHSDAATPSRVGNPWKRAALPHQGWATPEGSRFCLRRVDAIGLPSLNAIRRRSGDAEVR